MEVDLNTIHVDSSSNTAGDTSEDIHIDIHGRDLEDDVEAISKPKEVVSCQMERNKDGGAGRMPCVY